MKIITYKEKEGLIIRIVSWALASLLALFGCISLYNYFSFEDISQTPPVSTFWGTTLLQIPFFEVNIRVGLLISVVIFLIVVWLLNRFVVNKAASADFLLDTEYELRKVSWPPRAEYWGSSVAVIISTVIIGAFIFVVDMILIQLTGFLYLR